MVIISIFLVINDAECLFIGLFASIYPLCYPFKAFKYFSVGVFVFLPLSFESSLYIVDTSPLSGM